MTLAGLLVRDLTIITPGTTTDIYNNARPDWDAASETRVRGWVAQRGRTEDGIGRLGAVTEWSAMLPADAVVTANDRITDGTTTWEVEGKPAPAYSPRGVHHLEVTLREVDG